MHPPKPKTGMLNSHWNKKVSSLVQMNNPTVQIGLKERHLVFSSLVMALISVYWNANKRGTEGKYPLSNKGSRGSKQTYLGHNIACIAVNSKGAIIDFDFNHNEIFNSSMEHAEARLVRRLFRNTKLRRPNAPSFPRPEKTAGTIFEKIAYPVWNILGEIVDGTVDAVAQKNSHYGNALGGITIYTSLESCAQCSGIMTLGGVKEVVFLQRDPGQNSIGNILYNLSPKFSPKPLPADIIGIKQFGELDNGYEAFQKNAKTQPFYVSPNGREEFSSSITSFLCTDIAFDIFDSGKKEFEQLKLQNPKWAPTVLGAINNEKVLEEAKQFFRYAVNLGRRGTPHT